MISVCIHIGYEIYVKVLLCIVLGFVCIRGIWGMLGSGWFYGIVEHDQFDFIYFVVLCMHWMF